MRRQIHGILLLDKPQGMTSNGALQRVKRLYYAKKAGHTGSLDPLATGMLPICFGEATKFSQFLLESDKSYYAVAKLGVRTNTGDSEGEVIETQAVNVTVERIQQLLPQFLGEIEQVPPMFSALKFQGKPLYELARKGISIERKARKVNIFSLTLDKLEQDIAAFQVHCSKGTYIRTLVEDIGQALGCGAHIIELRRNMVAPYQHATMHRLETLTQQENIDKLLSFLLPVETAMQAFPAVQLTNSGTFYMRTGQAVRASFPADATLVRLIADDGCFIGMGEVLGDGRIKPHRLLATS
jgi:tRNA pseudouridine55 synthase